MGRRLNPAQRHALSWRLLDITTAITQSAEQFEADNPAQQICAEWLEALGHALEGRRPAAMFPLLSEDVTGILLATDQPAAAADAAGISVLISKGIVRPAYLAEQRWRAHLNHQNRKAQA